MILQDTTLKLSILLKIQIKVCCYLLKQIYIRCKLVDISFFTDSVPQEVIACEAVRNNDNSLIIAFVCLNSTADNTNSSDITLRALAERYYSNLAVLGDFNYPKIDWTHSTTISNTNDPNFMFLKTICFLQQYVRSPARGGNCAADK